MTELEESLHSIEADQSKFEEAKRGCDSQKFHAKEQEEGLKANLALMSAAHDHAEKAIKAAQANVDGIEKKAKALTKSSYDFTHISAEAIKSLEAQSKDRNTILMAVRKAAEMVAPVDSSTEAGNGVHAGTAELLQTLAEDISEQEVKEHAYQIQQDAFQSEFLDYVKDYTQLLEERRRHYEVSRGVL